MNPEYATVEKIVEGDPDDPDVTFAVYMGERYVGYLEQLSGDEPMLNFIGSFTLSEQIKALQDCQHFLKEHPLDTL